MKNEINAASSTAPAKRALKLGVIGHPVGHSLSPALHKVFAEAKGVEITYEKFDVPPAKLPEFMKNAALALDGFSVTIPHKLSVMGYLSSADANSTAIGAVNTVLRRDKDFFGYNTDIDGFAQSLARAGERGSPAGKKVFMWGAGGAARAVAKAMGAQKAGLITVANRDPGKAEDFCGLTGDTPCLVMGIGDEKKLIESIVAADIIVNATSVGMAGGPDPEGLPPGASAIRAGQLVVDIVYKPLVTPLLKAAGEAGAGTLDGLWMLIYQGAVAFDIWLGNRPVPGGYPAQKARDALLMELGEKRDQPGV
ncbi:MAG: shikimate dehydrogenase [Nitrospinae bacterium]|nr:shikimate dehydrogenase [Nitrospinota bacterium]